MQNEKCKMGRHSYGRYSTFCTLHFALCILHSPLSFPGSRWDRSGRQMTNRDHRHSHAERGSKENGKCKVRRPSFCILHFALCILHSLLGADFPTSRSVVAAPPKRANSSPSRLSRRASLRCRAAARGLSQFSCRRKWDCPPLATQSAKSVVRSCCAKRTRYFERRDYRHSPPADQGWLRGGGVSRGGRHPMGP